MDIERTRTMIATGNHRGIVGGMWNEIGKLQFDYLKANGLEPKHRLLDVGCGSLRGGVHFIPYLEPDNYYGFDLNMPLIQAGLEVEIAQIDLSHKVSLQNFYSTYNFEYAPHWPRMDMAVGISILTHLNFDSVCLCLKSTAQILKPNARFYATIFEASDSNQASEPIEHCPGIVTHALKDPYHYTRAQMDQAAKLAGFSVFDIEDFNHPRNQKMMVLERVQDS